MDGFDEIRFEDELDDDIAESREAISKHAGDIKPFKSSPQDSEKEKPHLVENFELSQEERDMLRGEPEELEPEDDEEESSSAESEESVSIRPIEDYYPGSKPSGGAKNKSADIPKFDLKRDFSAKGRVESSAKRTRLSAQPAGEIKEEKRPMPAEPKRHVKNAPGSFACESVISEIVARDIRQLCGKAEIA